VGFPAGHQLAAVVHQLYFGSPKATVIFEYEGIMAEVLS
jgi:hypothetical protein